jgi:mediator of RNA polymerase II transcription subunit 12, fungi type
MFPDNDPLSSVEHAINCVNIFSLPFCQLKIQLLFNSGDGENFKQRISDVMLKAAVADIQSGRTNWLDLAAVMRDEVVQEVRIKPKIASMDSI